VHPRTRRTLAPFCAAATVIAAGCTIAGLDECGEPQRQLNSVWVEGQLPTTAQSIFVQVTLYQDKGSPMRGWWMVQADALRSHVTGVELRDGGELVATLPLAPPAPVAAGPISYGENLPSQVHIALEDAWGRLAAGRVAVELRTDLPERPLIRLARPHSQNATGYERGSCY